MKIKNNKNGGFSCFLAIVLTAAVLLMSVLAKASSIRYEETLLTGILVQQQDLVLSEYSEKLLDWYGIYATQLQNNKEDAFSIAITGMDRIDSYSCNGTGLLDDAGNLKKGILSFARPRVPMQLTLQLLSRFTEMNAIIAEQNKKQSDIADQNKKQPNIEEQENKQTVDSTSNSPYSTIDVDDMNKKSTLSFDKIIETISLIDKSAFEKNTSEENRESLSWEELNELLKNKNNNPIQEMDLSKQMKSSLTVTESNLNDMSSFLEQFCQIETNSLYDNLCFEFYVSSMFSCKTNKRIQDGIEIERKDLRNRSISTLPTQSRLELEKIIFGYEKEETNDYFTKISIESIRFLIHLIINLTDEAKKSEINVIAMSLCSLITLVSCGTVVVPPEAMKVVVLILASMNSAIQDYSNLSKGEAVNFIPIKNFKKIDTYYTDYLQIFLLAVPEQVKINRMLEIIRKNLCMTMAPLYTGVFVSTKYRDIIYKVEGGYDSYISN